MLPSIWLVSSAALATVYSTIERPSRVAMWVASLVACTHIRYRPWARVRRSPPRRFRAFARAPPLSEAPSGAEASTGVSALRGVVERDWLPWPPPDPPLPRPRPPRRRRFWPPPPVLAEPPLVDTGGVEALPGRVSPIWGAGRVSPIRGLVGTAD